MSNSSYITHYPKVYILILNWNGWQDTIECLESVFRNTYLNYQVVVIDNSSLNNSMEYIKAWAEGRQEILTSEPSHPLYHLSHPPVNKSIPYVCYSREEAERGGNLEKEKLLYNKSSKSIPHLLVLIQTSTNLGFAGGNNVGIRYALAKGDCDYIWLLNNDTVIDKDVLHEVIKLAESENNIGLIGSKIYYYTDVDQILSIGGNYRENWFESLPQIGSFEKDNLVKWNKNMEIFGYINGANLLIKKITIDDIGLLDENYFMGVEDIDWGIVARKKTWRLFCCSKGKIWHKEGKSTVDNSDLRLLKTFLWKKSTRIPVEGFFRNYYGLRNRIYFVRKNFRNKFLLYIFFILPFQLFHQFLGIIVYNDNYKLTRVKLLFRAVYDGLTGKMRKTIDPGEWKIILEGNALK